MDMTKLYYNPEQREKNMPQNNNIPINDTIVIGRWEAFKIDARQRKEAKHRGKLSPLGMN